MSLVIRAVKHVAPAVRASAVGTAIERRVLSSLLLEPQNQTLGVGNFLSKGCRFPTQPSGDLPFQTLTKRLKVPLLTGNRLVHFLQIHVRLPSRCCDVGSGLRCPLSKKSFNG